MLSLLPKREPQVFLGFRVGEGLLVQPTCVLVLDDDETHAQPIHP